MPDQLFIVRCELIDSVNVAAPGGIEAMRRAVKVFARQYGVDPDRVIATSCRGATDREAEAFRKRRKVAAKESAR